ncbi:MAG: DUF512 domain-containing protein [Lachnospiraceae bacterium]|nr:DUF512 domain-containing protein [Lachnospiraceae bacterium]
MAGKHTIVGVEPGSIAHELSIEPGDVLLTVNGETVRDIFDYQFLVMDEFVTLEIEKKNGDIDEIEIEKDLEEDLGISFDTDLMDEYRSCTNNCIFCFIDQMPPGMRDTLYFKDDDSRLSFLQGNYITLTNMKEADIDRIIRYRMEPINISIHTTDPQLRCRMLNNRFAGDCLRFLDKLYDAGIRMNGQIVLCKGINDGEALEKTLSDLSRYAPVMESVSIVPVGLTRYRDGLFPLEPFSKKDAENVIKVVEKFQRTIYNKLLTHFVHASDEFYLLAEMPLPEEERYDGYLQLENGVGMLRLLEQEFHKALNAVDLEMMSGVRNISIATGALAYPYIKELVADTEEAIRSKQCDITIRCRCHQIRNDFFGENITVSGLICGQDIISQLKDQDLGDELLLPVNMFRSGEEYFLDDVTKTDLERELHVKVIVVPKHGEGLLRGILGLENTDFRRQIYEQADRSDRWQA